MNPHSSKVGVRAPNAPAPQPGTRAALEPARGSSGRRLVGLLVVLALLGVTPQLASAQPRNGQADTEEDETLYSCKKARGPIAVSFKPEVELKDLVTWVMGFTCRNFLMSSTIGGRNAKVTIIAPKKMSAREAYNLFLAALQTMNLTVVPKGNALEIVEAPQSKTEALPVYRESTPPSTAQMVRAIMRPEFIGVDDLGTIFNAMKSKDGVVTPVPRFGLVVVTDYGTHIAKMKYLMSEVDQPSTGEQLYMIKVRYADATELAGKLQEILGASGPQAAQPAAPPARGRRARNAPAQAQAPVPEASGGDDVDTAVPTKILADDRTNSLILMASEAAYQRTLALVRRLDVAIDVEGVGRVHVYYLENADAEELATTLQAVISGMPQASAQRGAAPGRPAPARAPQPGGGGELSATFEGEVRVSHDKPTNSLVVIASAKDFLSLRDVIRKLDVARRQVFIEAVILELKVDNSLNLGVSWHGGGEVDDGGLVIGGLQHSDLQSINVASLASQTGLLGGLLGPLLPESEQFLGTSIPSYGVLVQALANNSNVNVLSSPHLLTMDNQPAEISVGENIPYQSALTNFGFGGGQQGGQQGGFGFPVQSIQRQDVALTLKITPHINQADLVRLEIDQEISDIASPNFEGLGPSWAKRSVKTTVVVRDQQTIVIGGLMSDKITYSESKVPLLGDIPILGYLFKRTQRNKAKTNLLIMLTPYVVKDQLDIEQIVQRKVRERREFVRAFVGLRAREYEPQIDYQRKRGLLEEINRTVEMVERERRAFEEATMKLETFPDGPIEVGGRPAAEEPVVAPDEPVDGDAAGDDVAE